MLYAPARQMTTFSTGLLTLCKQKADLSLKDLEEKRRIKPENRRIRNRKLLRKEMHKMRQLETKQQVVITGLGKIKDARQTLNAKKTVLVQDARLKITNKSPAFDARSKINLKQKSVQQFDARQKIQSKTVKQRDARQNIQLKTAKQRQQTTEDIFVPKVTITGLGSIRPSGVQRGFDEVEEEEEDEDEEDDGPTGFSSEFNGGNRQAMPLFRRTIANDAGAAVKDLVITTKQAVKRRPSPIRPPPILAAKLSRPDPIREQVPQSHPSNIIKLPKAHATPLSRPQPNISPQKRPAPQLMTQASAGISGSPLQGFKLVITNLGNLVSHDDILELFGSIGAIKRARIIKPGHAEVVYVKKEDANAAIAQYHLRELDGQPMNVALVTPQSQAPAPKPPAPKQQAPAAPSTEATGPLRLSKGSTPNKKKLDIDPDLIHSALFKSKEKRPSKPVSFSITI